MPKGNQRRLAAIVSADVVGYSRLMSVDETGTLAALRSHRTELIDNKIDEYGGRIVKTMGDGLLLEFPSVVQATNCVIEVQQGMAERNENVDEDHRIAFRIGVNLGDVIIDGDDILGDGVNIAARLQEIAEPGGLTISRRVYEDVQDRLDFTFEGAGEQILKNIARPIEVWRWLPIPKTAGNHEPPPLPNKPSIAVLPFDNMSGDPEQEYFADGITEDLITAISRFRWFFVIARNSTFVYKGKAVDIRSVSKELGVHYVIEGSVRKAGPRVRINVQLIEAISGNHVWAEQFDRDLDDVFQVQDEITQNVSAAIEPQLLAAEAAHSTSRTSDNLDAWGFVVRARNHFWRMTKPESQEAIRLLETAVELNPGYAPAQSALSFALLFSIHMGWAPAGDNQQVALNYAVKAAEIDNMDPWAHVSSGYLAIFKRESESALTSFNRAIDLNPNFATAIGWRGLACAFAGRTDEALPDLELAMRLSPLDPQNAVFVSAAGVALYLVGRYEDALVHTTKSVELRPDFVGANRIHCSVLSQLGRTEEARHVFKHVLEMQPNVSSSLLRKTVPYAREEDMEHFLLGLKKAGMSN